MKRISRRNFLGLMALGGSSAVLFNSLRAVKASTADTHLVYLPIIGSDRPPRATWIATLRIGQLTGSTDLDEDQPKWPYTVDAQGWPLLTDTGPWGVSGVDLGANTEHADTEHPGGRLFFFFGDVATKRDSGNPLNSDLVAWTDETRVLQHGGHLALGWTFVLPFEPTSVPGQPDWRFCGKCSGLFYDGYPDFKGACIRGGGHEAIGLRFVLPYQPTSVQGQPDWRYCGKCAGLFWDGDPNFKGACPAGGTHSSIGWTFVMPFQPTSVAGQPDWRFCGKCAGMFWNGDANKGVCPGADGGGFHLHGVLNDRGKFDPFSADAPIGQTLSLETPNGAFSWAGRAYVFAGISEERYSGQKRFGDPAYGCYLVSKERPDLPGPYRKEFLFSPRIGWCPRDQSRNLMESHEILGFKFVVPHDIPEDPTRQANWRFCGKCGAMFWDGDADKGVCFRGGSHEAGGANYVLSHSIAEDAQNQANWRYCSKCGSMFWDGDPNAKGLCPAGGSHQATGANFVLQHPSIDEDATHQATWRYCGKCAGMFWDGSADKGICPRDGGSHEAWGFNFVLQHDVPEDPQNQRNWRFCSKCVGLFWDGDPNFKGACPRGGAHEAIGYNFVLLHDVADDSQDQADWRYCGKCAGLFWDGDPDFKGFCPAGDAHEAIGYNFVLPHNPGEDPLSQGGWRFCTKCHGLVWSRQEDLFSWVAPVVVLNGDHPGLPSTSASYGIVMFGFFYSSNPGIRLAWVPLPDTNAPRLQDILYYTGDPAQPWSPNAEAAKVIVPHTNSYTHLSAAWLEGPKRWILLYSNAYDDESKPTGDTYHRPAVARIGKSPWNWSDEIEIFNPVREQAYGSYMHQVGRDSINPNVPPREDPNKPEHDGWAYGAFLLNRFTTWTATNRRLRIYYLLSLSSPYQVQLMVTNLRVD